MRAALSGPAIVEALAQASMLRDPNSFAQVWHMLMKGSIIAACEGNRNAARDAKRAARLVLDRSAAGGAATGFGHRAVESARVACPAASTSARPQPSAHTLLGATGIPKIANSEDSAHDTF